MIYKPDKKVEDMTEEELEAFLASIDPDEVTPENMEDQH